MDEAGIRQALERALNDPASGTTFLNRFLGVRIAPGSDVTTLDFDVHEAYCNRQGTLHGGIMALLFDIVMGNHHRHSLGVGVTLELKVQYFRPVTAGALRCEARFLSQGRRLSFIEGKLLAGDTVAAGATSTWFRSNGPDGQAK